jgi:hypothetical protein
MIQTPKESNFLLYVRPVIMHYWKRFQESYGHRDMTPKHETIYDTSQMRGEHQNDQAFLEAHDQIKKLVSLVDYAERNNDIELMFEIYRMQQQPFSYGAKLGGLSDPYGYKTFKNHLIRLNKRFHGPAIAKASYRANLSSSDHYEYERLKASYNDLHQAKQQTEEQMKTFLRTVKGYLDQDSLINEDQIREQLQTLEESFSEEEPFTASEYSEGALEITSSSSVPQQPPQEEQEVIQTSQLTQPTQRSASKEGSEPRGPAHQSHNPRSFFSEQPEATQQPQHKTDEQESTIEADKATETKLQQH